MKRVLSVSQAKTWEGCRAHWKRIYLDGLRDPENEATKFGHEVHETLARAIVSGRLTGDSGSRSFLAAQTLWDAVVHRLQPLAHDGVEGDWSVDLVDGWELRVRPDLVTSTYTVLDWKTERVPRFRPEWRDQLVIYAIGVGLRFEVKPPFKASVVTVTANPPWLHGRYDLTIDRQEMVSQWKRLKRIAGEIDMALEACGPFPRGSGGGCRWCPVGGEC